MSAVVGVIDACPASHEEYFLEADDREDLGINEKLNKYIGKNVPPIYLVYPITLNKLAKMYCSFIWPIQSLPIHTSI